MAHHAHHAAILLTASTLVTLDELANVELCYLPPAGATLELWINGVRLEPFLRPGDPHWYWRWIVPGTAGMIPAEVQTIWPDGSRQQQRHTIMVQPRKLDQTHYNALLADLAALSRQLVLHLNGSSAPAQFTPTQELLTPADTLALCTGAEVERFCAAVVRIAQRPPARTWRIAAVPPTQVRDMSRIGSSHLEPAANAADLPSSPLSAAHLRSLPEAQPIPDRTGYEMHLLVRTLHLLHQRLSILASTPDLPLHAAACLADTRARLHTLIHHPAFADVRPLERYHGPTPQLQRDADYRQVLRMWQRLRQTAMLTWEAPTFSLPIADLPLLYERWCLLLTLNTLLAEPDWTITRQHLFSGGAHPDQPWRLHIPSATPLLVQTHPSGTTRTLFYQPRYRPHPSADQLGSLDRHTRIPDFALSVEHPAAPPELHLLDAKYRLNGRGGLPESALADAYSYLGSIGMANGRTCVQRVALLYPGTGPAESYASRVAALPMLPGATTHLHTWMTSIPML
jgi:large subunit ribosomal protein MRP49